MLQHAARHEAFAAQRACLITFLNSSISVFLHDRRVYSSTEGFDECTLPLSAHEALHGANKECCSTHQGIRQFQLSVRA
jgi:hypothetical protein